MPKLTYLKQTKFPRPSRPEPRPVSVDYPRIFAASGKPVLVIRDDPTCLSVPESGRDEGFWGRCGIQPIDTKSNVLVGLTESNYRNLTLNVLGLRTYARKLENVVSAYEKQVDDNNRRADQADRSQ